MAAPITPCMRDPDLWMDKPHDDKHTDPMPEARARCMDCHRYVDCAQDALAQEHPRGVYAGVYVPLYVKGYRTRTGSEAKCAAAINQLKRIVNVA